MPQLLLFPLTRSIFRGQYRRQLGVVPTIGLLAGDFFPAVERFRDRTFPDQILARNGAPRTLHPSLRESGDQSFRGQLASRDYAAQKHLADFQNRAF